MMNSTKSVLAKLFLVFSASYLAAPNVPGCLDCGGFELTTIGATYDVDFSFAASDYYEVRVTIDTGKVNLACDTSPNPTLTTADCVATAEFGSDAVCTYTESSAGTRYCTVYAVDVTAKGDIEVNDLP